MRPAARTVYPLRRAGVFLMCALVTILSGICAAQDSSLHIVDGTVTSEDGSAVEGACVSALPTDSTAGNFGCVKSDQEGRFRLTLPTGKYLVRAKDEAAGYPDPMFLLSADPTTSFPEVAVGGSNVSGVRVVLGTKGGIIEGKVCDRSSDLPIPRARVTIRDKINPSAYVEVFSDAKGHFQFTVPAKPVSVSVTATGYESAPAEEITLSGGQHRALEFNLKRH